MFLQAIRRSVPTAARSFATTRVSANVIQDLYLKEIKSVKLQPISAKDAEGAVKPWVAPQAPKIPQVEAQGADALKAYAEQDVEVAKEKGEEASNETDEQDWLVLEEIEDDHHH
ncbi:LAFE_0C07712g1_1 [Lachancea fermentati]|uniref:LAFE_0C07712g1_1 n=1 Tax=Lachancea fermentati TaxID=4955 RepID=A0A1G4M9S9_LACFM|nr:LAFE_0C07712g1_1 [Lachancea fermentati]